MLACNDDQADIGVRGTRKNQQVFPKGAEIPEIDESPNLVYRLMSGFVCRYQLLLCGRRQITALIFPGDAFDCEKTDRYMDGSGFNALTSCEVLQYSMSHGKRYEHLQRREAVACQWLVNLGQRSALQRLAHFICEFNVRLMRVGLSSKDSFPFPVCQTDIADILGLSTVHVNRSWQSLRAADLINLRQRRLTILDFAALKKLALFDPNYLLYEPVDPSSQCATA